MPLNVTITKPQVYDRYGILMNVGQTYLVDDDFARSLVQSLKATDVAGILTYPFSTFQPGLDFLTLDAIDTANSGTTGTTLQQLNPNHRAIPSNLVKINDRLKLNLSLSKNGTSDTATFLIKYGPLGTSADATIATINAVATTNQSYGTILEFKRVSLTQLQKLGSADANYSFSTAAPAAPTAAVTVGDMTAQPMFLSIVAQMTSGTEIPTVNDYTLELYITDTNQT